MSLTNRDDGQSHTALPVRAPGVERRVNARGPIGLAVLVVMLVPTITPWLACAQTDQWQVGTASSYSNGRYEADTATSVIYTPITARRIFTDGDLTLILPWTCIKGAGGVTVVNGAPVRNERRTGSTGTLSRPGADDGLERAGTPSAPVNACGLGDVVVRGRYYLVDERGWVPTIAVRAHVKAPTASARRGLGTGRPDEGVGVEVSRTLPRDVLVMVDGGYTIIGSPPGAGYQNSWWYDAGVARDFASRRVTLSLFFEEYRAILPGSENSRGLLASAMFGAATAWRVQVSTEFGISDGAPDHGLMVGASRRF